MNKTEIIINHLKEIIQTGKEIPTENSLAEQFNVSRSVSREALKFLQLLGVITVQKGSGYKVNKEISKSMTGIMQMFLDLKAYSYKDIADIREALEIKELFLIQPEQVSQTDYNYLYNTIEIMEKDSDSKKIIKADINFHRKIAELSKSSLIYDIMESLAGLRRNYILIPWGNISLEAKSDLINAHKDIIAAFNKDTIAKSKAISRHYQIANDTIGLKEILYSGIKKIENYTLNELKNLGLGAKEVATLFSEIDNF